jgi:hypothetical protein
MRGIVRSKPDFDKDSIATLCVAAALNDYQESVAANPAQGSYWGRFVNWALNGGRGSPPWRRFPKRKAARFERFRGSPLWHAKFLEMDSGQIRSILADVMEQKPSQKTMCFAPLVVARWAYVLDVPFTVVLDHPLPIDSRIKRLRDRIPGFDAKEAIQRANEPRQTIGRRDLNMSDFDAWAWQHMS